ncbi:interleukin-17D-like [Pecten maximus]|uniref:interleukin-17D-like n=1 Tax=Pecten maximus TaxID=6579 RepID=UPI0014590A3D|nr:interleukin-17D-like [Pecten maximus]
MDPMDVLLWFSIATSVLAASFGRSISTSRSDILRRRRSGFERLVRAELPKSMTMIRRLSEIVPIDQMELIIESIKLYGTECPGSKEDLPVNGPVYARSNCPWYYELHYDPDRFPASLPQAVSKCRSQCLGLPDEIVDDFTCEYVYNNVTVLVRDNQNDTLRFIEKVQRIAVGSTCVKKIVTV